ncbi:terminase gpA endonuclease subunit [Clostridium sp. KNHs216]|uniref:terminase gpA endonuclease subunit n=1 Tax=Clostridium sp. KNHs216 TaxID=1550235 RepID=UPI0011698D04|nr:phage terminase large subunit GpA-like protein [Clostridium sp. KNHs216]
MNSYKVPDWLRSALVSLRPPGKKTVSEWADENRILSLSESSKPGPWRTDYVPYLREVMDAFSDPEVVEEEFIKATQVGGTEAILNMMGAAICQDPGPMLVVYPQKELAERISDHRIQPMMKNCRELKKRFDENSKRLDLNFTGGINIGIVGANSPSDLASFPIRYVFLDEEDKYPIQAGKEASPAKLAMERQKSYPANKKTVRVSTPVFESGPTWQNWLKADTQMECFVSCPHCGASWTFKFRQLKWPDGSTPDQARKEAFYVCEECGCLISDADRNEMVRHCEWKAVRTNGSRRKIAFRLNAFYSPLLRFGDIASEFLDSKGQPELLQNFINSWLGEPFKEIEQELDAERLLKEKQSVYPSKVVPPNTVMLTGGVDVQRKSFYYTIRAWRANMTSYNVLHGQVFTWAEIEEIMNRWYKDKAGVRYQVNLCCVDSGDQTDDVYDFCAVNREWTVPIKGSSSRMITKYRPSVIDRDGISKGMTLLIVDTDYYKDMIFSRIFRDEDNGGWYLHERCDPEYAEMITAEQKVVERVRGHLIRHWVQKATGGDNHYLDCEVYAACAADVFGIRTLHANHTRQERGDSQPMRTPQINPEILPAKENHSNQIHSGKSFRKRRWRY